MLWRGMRIERGTELRAAWTGGNTVERIEAADPDNPAAGVFASGYVSTTRLDVDRWSIHAEAWAESLDFWQRQIKRPLPMFWNHDRDKPIGRHPNLKITTDGLWTERAEFDMEDPEARAAVGRLARGFVWGWSVGFRVNAEPEYDKSEDVLHFKGGLFLFEASLVTVPANMWSQATAPVAAQQADLAVAKAEIEELRRQVLELRAEVREEIEESVRAMATDVRAFAEKAALTRTADDLRKAIRSFRYEAPMVDPGGDYPGGGGGQPPPQPPPPDPVNPNQPPAGSPEAGGDRPTGGPGDDKRPMENGPRDTPADLVDGHRHNIVELLGDGTGMTSMDSSEAFLAHAHRIDGWTVKDVEVAGKVSQHPGDVYPPGGLEALEDFTGRMRTELEEAVARCFTAMIGRTE